MCTEFRVSKSITEYITATADIYFTCNILLTLSKLPIGFFLPPPRKFETVSYSLDSIFVKPLISRSRGKSEHFFFCNYNYIDLPDRITMTYTSWSGVKATQGSPRVMLVVKK